MKSVFAILLVLIGAGSPIAAQDVRKSPLDDLAKTDLRSSPAGRAVCTIGLTQSPEIRGIKLGMPEKDFLNLLAPLGQELFRATKTAFFYHFADAKKLAGVLYVNAEFHAGRLLTFSINYDGSTQWRNDAEFASSIGQTLNLPEGAWEPGVRGRTMNCDGFAVEARENFVRFRDVSAERARISADREEAERRKKAFKP